MTDITGLILADHRRIRRLEAALRTAARRGGAEPSWVLPTTWQHLATVIEEHLRAVEAIGWPAICGTGPRGQAQVRQMTAAATQIRDAIATARAQPAGSPGWWQATGDALTACAVQLDSEERTLLRGLASPPAGDQLGRQWLALRNHPRPSPTRPQAHDDQDATQNRPPQ